MVSYRVILAPGWSQQTISPCLPTNFSEVLMNIVHKIHYIDDGALVDEELKCQDACLALPR